MTGALLVDKPSGPTSHDVVAVARRVLHTSRIGHTGTLDPLATGLLVLLIGPATRLARFLAADEKEYLADVRLGIATPTYDAASLAEGVRCPMADERWPMDVELEGVLDRFRGAFLQTPPPYSAKKVAGVAAYEKARRHESVDLKPVPVTVRSLQVVHTSDGGHRTSGIGRSGLIRLRVAASAGFYVRSLAHDLGRALGCGAHLEALRRIRVGTFRVDEAATIDTLQAAGAAGARLIPVNALLSSMPAVSLTAEGLRRAVHGNALAPCHLERTEGVIPGSGTFRPPPGTEGVRAGSGTFAGESLLVRVLDAAGETLAVAESRPDGLLHPLVVLG